MLTPDDALDRLHRAGWSVGETRFGTTLFVCGTNGENVIRAEGRTQAEAWLVPCDQAAMVRMLASGRPLPWSR